MKCKRFIVGSLLATCIAFAGLVGVAASQSDNEAALAQRAKISLNEAVNSAVKAVPGKVLKSELEEEDGALIYSIEIVKADRSIGEVNVNAVNGKVLKIENEKPEGRDVKDTENGREEKD